MHRRDVKKIPMTDKISQIYEEEQINKTRNGRKLVPDNKIPNLQWNLEKQGTTCKEEVQETQEINKLNRIQEVIIYIMISIYSCILQIQNTVVQYTSSAIETAHNVITMTKDISRTSWIKIQKEVQAKQEHLHAHRGNLKNQWYKPRNSHGESIPTQ